MLAAARRRIPLSSCVLVLGLAVVVAAPPVARAETWSVAGPDGTMRARVTQPAPGARLTLSVERGRTPVLAPSPLGLVTSRGDMSTGLRFSGRTDRAIDEQYDTATGGQRVHRHRANAMTLRFTATSGQVVDLDVRATEDGVAYRYGLPGSGPITVERETGGFVPASPGRAWLQPYTPNYEALWAGLSERSVTEAAGQFGFPALFELQAGTWALLAESAVDGRYVTSMLQADPQRTRFDIAFPVPHTSTDVGPVPASPLPARPTADLPLATPWRVVIAGDLATVATSDLVTDLAPPRAGGDWSWVRPGKVAWSWWSNWDSPKDMAEQQRYVDFAARHGWPFVLVDAGWRTYERRIPELVRYAAERGVRIILWLHNDEVDTPGEREVLRRIADAGVAGVKIDFFDSDDQDTMRLYDTLLEETARLRLMVNFHGATLPKGLRRRWPHLMTYEAVRGAEFYHWNDRYKIAPAPTPEHNTTIPFTRGVLGPTDYTPTTFSAPGRRTSDGHELALAVVYESGWLHPADSRETYERHDVALRYLDALPTTWDETRLLSGRPGSEATFARRAGDEWWIGSIVAGPARRVPVRADMLAPGREYAAEIVADRPGGGLGVRSTAVTRGDTLDVAVPEHGGFVVRLRPASAPVPPPG